jgi:hypothetical protein
MPSTGGASIGSHISEISMCEFRFSSVASLALMDRVIFVQMTSVVENPVRYSVFFINRDTLLDSSYCFEWTECT